ncbi:MAG: hypothetical protein ACI4XA_01190 [Oscillospiraceae bacterium]
MKNPRKFTAFMLSLCLLTACAPAEQSSSQPQTTPAQSTTASETTATATEKTTPAETAPEPAEPTAEPVSEQDKPVEEEIVPLEITPESIPEDAPRGGLSELAAITTLIKSADQPMEYYTSAMFFDLGSTIDEPLPNSTFITSWGCYPTVIADSVNANALSEGIDTTAYIDIPGTKLYELIDNNTPVMVWVTEELLPPELVAEGEGIKMYDPHETVILVGYSEHYVMVWSPFQDNYVTYDRALFEQRFEELGSFALTVTKE